MAFIVEDGTGVSGANSYATTATADTYLGDRGYTAWAGYTTAQKQARLINATQYVDNAYKWPGVKQDTANALNWPRSGAYDAEGTGIDNDTIPQALKDAVCLAALESSLVETLDRGGAVQSETVAVISKTYFASASPGKTFPQVTLALKPLLGGGSQGRVTR